MNASRWVRITGLAAIMITLHTPTQARDILKDGDAVPRYGLDEIIREKISVSSKTVEQVMLIDGQNMRSAVLFLRSKPLIGFEGNSYLNKESPKRFGYTVDNLSLRDALNLLISKDADFKWVFSNDVINIFPTNSTLDIKVPQFVAQDVGIYGAAAVLKEQLTQPGYEHAIDGFIEQASPYYTSDGPRFNINLTNPTLRECLNEMIRQDGSHDWLVRHGPTGTLIHFMPRQAGLKTAYQKAKKRRILESEKRMLKEGFRKTKTGTWVKPGPGGKWVTPKDSNERKVPVRN